MDHAAVSALSCASCHGTGLSFVGTPAVVTLPAKHVPVSATDCALCHGNTNSGSFVFGNASGTAPPSMVHGAVSAAACSSWHAKGMSWIASPETLVHPATNADGTEHAPAGDC